jgi:Flp pilus assembly protein TadG
MTALLAGFLLIALAWTSVVAGLGSYNEAVLKAGNAADAAALAAMQEQVTGGDPRQAASEYAAANGAKLVGFRSDGESVTVTVRKSAGGEIAGFADVAIPAAVVSGKAELKDFDDREF